MQTTPPEKPQTFRSTQLVLENLGVLKLGTKREPNIPFKGKAIAKVVRSNYDVDHVVIKWDDIRERPFVIFDPNTSRGMIMEFIFFYTYDWDKLREQDEMVAQDSKRVGTRPIHDMDLYEINLELLYVHGVKEDTLEQYLSVHARRALLAQKRAEYGGEKK